MKILLFGKDGQVGQELQRTLLPMGEVIALGRAQADFSDLACLRDILQAQSPGIIVNAAAYTAVDKAETEPEAAFKINAEAVAVLAAYALDQRALLVHYSTDYVFDGSKPDPCLETDGANPLNVYGRSKLAGEKAILDSGCKALIFRTSWVFSAHGANFVKTILRLARERDSIGIVADQYGAPTSAELIADVTAHAIVGYASGRITAGLYHLTASGATSWHGFACHVLERARANGAALTLESANIRAIATEDYPLPAQRPRNSCLDCHRLAAGLGLQLPDWKIHVNRAVDQLTRSEITR